ncbi:hypothetical protein E2C01_028292 [Portunus trituberculatus]|uniref:Uncharacterized protein n=1 Tax=Portunus trituberculatus TaxID=210409 RepID=A0A5B7ENX6_PORTR|nr:hypothetical protein [Portunus trituberculatus]
MISLATLAREKEEHSRIVYGAQVTQLRSSTSHLVAATWWSLPAAAVRCRAPTIHTGSTAPVLWRLRQHCDALKITYDL